MLFRLAKVNKRAEPADMTKSEEKLWKETEKEIKKQYDPDEEPEKYYGTVTNVFKAKSKKRLGYDPFKKKKKKKKAFYLDTTPEAAPEGPETFEGEPGFSKIPGEYQDEVRQLWSEHIKPAVSGEQADRYVKEFAPVAGTGLSEAGHVTSAEPGVVFLALESLAKMHEDVGRRDELMAEVAATILHEIGHLAAGLEGGEAPADAMEAKHQHVVERVRQRATNSNKEHDMFIALAKTRKQAADLSQLSGQLTQAGDAAMAAFVGLQQTVKAAASSMMEQAQGAEAAGLPSPENVVQALQQLAGNSDTIALLLQEVNENIKEDPSGSMMVFMRARPQVDEFVNNLVGGHVEVRTPGSVEQRYMISPEEGNTWLGRLKGLLGQSPEFSYDTSAIDAISQAAMGAKQAVGTLANIYMSAQQAGGEVTQEDIDKNEELDQVLNGQKDESGKRVTRGLNSILRAIKFREDALDEYTKLEALQEKVQRLEGGGQVDLAERAKRELAKQQRKLEKTLSSQQLAGLENDSVEDIEADIAQLAQEAEPLQQRHEELTGKRLELPEKGPGYLDYNSLPEPTTSVPVMEAQRAGEMIEEYLQIDEDHEGKKNELLRLEELIDEKKDLLKSKELPDMVKVEEKARYEELLREREQLLADAEKSERLKDSYQRHLKIQLGGPEAVDAELKKVDDQIDNLERRIERMRLRGEAGEPPSEHWVRREFPKIKSELERLHKERGSIMSVPAKKVQWVKFEGEAQELWKKLSEEKSKLQDLEANLGGTVEITITKKVPRTDPTTGKELRGFEEIEEVKEVPVTEEVIAHAKERVEKLQERKGDLDRIFDFADALGVGAGKDVDKEIYDPLSEVLDVEKGEGAGDTKKRYIRRPWVTRERTYKGHDLIGRMLQGVGRAVSNPKKLEKQLERDHRRLERLLNYKKRGKMMLVSPETGDVVMEDELLRDAIAKNNAHLRRLEEAAEGASPEEQAMLQEKMSVLEERMKRHEKDLSKIDGPRPVYVPYDKEAAKWETINPDEIAGARNRIKDTRERLDQFTNPVIRDTMARMNEYIQEKLRGRELDMHFTGGRTYLTDVAEVEALEELSEKSELSDQIIKERLDRRVDLLAQYQQALADEMKQYREDYILYRELMRGNLPGADEMSPVQVVMRTEELREKLKASMDKLKAKLTNPIAAMRAGVMSTLTDIGKSLATHRTKTRGAGEREERQKGARESAESGEDLQRRYLEEKNWPAMASQYEKDLEKLKPLEFLADRNLSQEKRRERSALRNRVERYETEKALADELGVDTTKSGLKDPKTQGPAGDYHGLGKLKPSTIEHKKEELSDEERMLRRRKQDRIKENKERREKEREERREKGQAERMVGLSRSKMDADRRIRIEQQRVAKALAERGFETDIGRSLETHYREYLPKDDERNNLERKIRALESKFEEQMSLGDEEGAEETMKEIETSQDRRDELVVELAEMGRKLETEVRMGANSDNYTRFFRDLTAYKMAADRATKAEQKYEENETPNNAKKLKKAQEKLTKAAEKLAATVYSIGLQEEHKVAHAIGLIGEMAGFQTPFTGRELEAFRLPENRLRPQELAEYFVRRGK